MLTLEKSIKQSEREIDKTDLHAQELITLRARYNALSAEQGQKGGRLLAWQLKKLDKERATSTIQLPNDDIIIDPVLINDTFATYYKTLYQSELEESQMPFLNQVAMPTISNQDKYWMDRTLQSQEIAEAINHMKRGKTAGPDGLLIDIYKRFKNKLINPLKNMYEESFQNGTLPPSLRHALITLILKPDKPPSKCESYWPIS